MPDRTIRVRGARTHNLKDVDVEIPRERWTVVCGVSGSGKTSLVLDTLGAESRRRLLGTQGVAERAGESLARPDVDLVEGLPPAVVAGFSSRAPGPRETLGTVTETTHALRALFARAAVPHCPLCGRAVLSRGREAVVRSLLEEPEGTRVVLLAPRGRGPDALADAVKAGFVRVRLDGGAVARAEDVDPGSVPAGARLEVVVDRIVVKEGAAERLRASVEQSLDLGEGVARAAVEAPGREPREETFSGRPFCPFDETTYPPLTTSLFSPSSPQGACRACHGIGRTWKEGVKRREAWDAGVPCPECAGTRLLPFPRAARLGGRTLPELEALPARDLRGFLEGLPLSGSEAAVAGPARDDALQRLLFMEEVGLGYLALERAGETLSSGELRRARLAAACAARMTGLLFLLDEPTAGLHPGDRPPLRARLRKLVDEGNTLVAVEHDVETLREADWIVEMGPGAGALGGYVLRSAPAREAWERGGLLPEPAAPRAAPRTEAPPVVARGITLRNLRGIDVSFPSRGLTTVTGVSGAGKTTLVLDVLAPAARAVLEGGRARSGRLRSLEGMEAFDRVSVASGAPSRHPRATPGSVLGVLGPIREVFAATLEARARGWGPSRFSAQVSPSRCGACGGSGEQAVTLRDMPETRLPCETCRGRRFAPDVERVKVKGLSIADVLLLTLERAADAFRDLPRVGPALRAASDVGLGYVLLGEPTTRLSSGEALRLRLAGALGRSAVSRTLFLLDEPAAGLHPTDVAHLLKVFLRLVEAGSAVVAVEHHLDVVRQSDHVVEIGPGAAEDGGRVLYQGAPAGLLAVASSPTARALRSAASFTSPRGAGSGTAPRG